MPPRSPTHNPPPAPLALRIGTHNVASLLPKLDEAMACWRAAKLDVVVLQEVRAGNAQLMAILGRTQAEGWRAVFNPGPNPVSAGMAFLCRASLLAAGVLALPPGVWGGPEAWRGRVLAVPVDWGGHKLLLAGVHLPNTGQAEFLAAVLPELLARGPQASPARQLVLLGDFNFVHDVLRDRLRAPGVAAPADARTEGDRHGPPELAARLPGYVDAFRALHPTRRCFTFHGGFGAARLDRVYMPPTLTSRVHRCWVERVSPSDHRLVCVSLSAAVAPALAGPGLHRLRLNFWGVEAQREAFVQWLVDELALAPSAPAALLLWWPAFKRSLRAQARERNQAAAAPSTGAAAAAQLAARDALTAALDAADSGAADAVTRVSALRAAWAAAADAARRADATTDARQPPPWMHCDERPSPAITQLLRPTKAKQRVTALRDAQGGLLGPGAPQANAMAAHWAGVSAASPRDPAAMAEVLSAVTAPGAARFSQAQAAAMGDAAVSVEEVHAALTHMASGTSPGPDGVPVELFKRCREQFEPVLARLFSAVGAEGRTPPGFTDGAIITLPKGGDATQPGNYRPITLLNTDYRVLAKVLADRLLVSMGDVIDPAQTAFLRERRIGDNIMLLQLLPHSLAAQQRTALAAFLDVAKAYDTVDRGFLQHVMAAMGAGAALLRWVSTLLHDTRARAMVNGFASGLQPFAAGVRQGCPLSPLLYLFVGEALLRFLRARGFGIDVAAGQPRLVAAQYADDIQVFLEAHSAVRPLFLALETFRAASGQAVNAGKSKLLVLGAAAEPLPGAMAGGVPLVASATALGFTFHAAVDAQATPKRGWDDMLASVERAYTALAHTHMSAFGRAFGASSYGLSTLLFAAEFSPPLTGERLQRLVSATAKLVDRGVTPDTTQRGFHGVSAELMPGPPTSGGLGVLPWREHVRGRHAVWAARLLSAPEALPWTRLAAQLLATWWGGGDHCGWTPLVHLVGDGMQRVPQQAHANQTPVGPMPPPLARLLAGLSALPRVEAVLALPIGDWRTAAPLYANPLMAGVDQRGRWCCLAPPGLDVLRLRYHVRVVGDLLRLRAGVDGAPDGAHMAAVVQQARSEMGGHHSFDPLVRGAADLIPAALRPPMGWPAGRLTATTPRVRSQAAMRLVEHLGWRLEGLAGDAKAVPLAELTVASATALQLGAMRSARAARHAAFISEALGITGAPPPADAVHLCRLLRAIWHLGWSNQRKEHYWRLVLDGLPTAARMRGSTWDPCPCGCLLPGRRHHFWECPAAQAVASEIRRAAGTAQLACAHVWLMRPQGGVPEGAWQVVCMAALLAMWHACGTLVLPARRARFRGLEAERVPHAGRAAVEAFWGFLHEFACMARPPAGWRALLPPGSPFIHYPHATAGLRVNRV